MTSATQPPAPNQQQQQHAVAGVAVILASGAATTVVLPMILALLAPLGVSAPSGRAAASLADRLAPNLARTGGSAERQTVHAEATYRAAYLVNAARRIQEATETGVSLRDAVSGEQRFYRLHQAAGRQRRAAATAVDEAASRHGPVLGWYLGLAHSHTSECKVAAGCNFEASHPPVIGWPGAVHPGCRCFAGPAHAGAGWVDEVLTGLPRQVVAA